MSTYRKGLLVTTLLFISIGLLATCTPFIRSLSPNASHLEKLPSVNVQKLQVGETIDLYTGGSHVFVTKQSDPENPYLVYSIPYQDGKYGLPEFGWHRPILPCVNFVQEYGFQCLDLSRGSLDLVWWSYMKWDEHGRSSGAEMFGQVVPDFRSPRFKVVAGDLIFLSSY